MPTRALYIWATILAGIATFFVFVANAAQLAESYWVSTRGWVRSEIAATKTETRDQLKEIGDRQMKMQIFIANDTRRKIESEIANRNIILQNQTQMPPEVRRLLEDQVRDMNFDLGATKRDIERLEREDANRAR